ncbi:ArsR/SmtB family transcription factor [Herbaspirillum robiniae]|uniref:Transcriptional regulator n=1 Tax=Herbaspirillum robiniae TaxID=2014887 RepID=A0A246WQ04_9BURK|nr:helix-turn-helix domain-containing protein [Herbaspirillum robiniae]NUU01540.1 helix-turn-helix transcriptional regulator [Herbaspirillum robiniae]OWY28462.1 transcriptional regulator [Herbaspirillum robiniae]
MRPYKHPAADELVLERVLYALSDSIRLDIVRHLARVECATCGELDGGRPKSTVSHHFKVLREAGLVLTENTGTSHMNTLRRADVEGRFPGLLAAILSQGDAAVAATKKKAA